jgi:hypothetical protein
MTELKVAFVQDALPFCGGAEKVLLAALEVFPRAPVYTLVYNRRIRSVGLKNVAI